MPSHAIDIHPINTHVHHTHIHTSLSNPQIPSNLHSHLIHNSKGLYEKRRERTCACTVRLCLLFELFLGQHGWMWWQWCLSVNGCLLFLFASLLLLFRLTLKHFACSAYFIFFIEEIAHMYMFAQSSFNGSLHSRSNFQVEYARPTDSRRVRYLQHGFSPSSFSLFNVALALVVVGGSFFSTWALLVEMPPWSDCLADWRTRPTDQRQKTLCTVQHWCCSTSSFGYCSLDLKWVSQEARPTHAMTDNISLPFLLHSHSLSLSVSSLPPK